VLERWSRGVLERWSSGVVQRCYTAKRNGLNGAQSWPGNPLSPPNGEPRTHLVLSEKVGLGKGIGFRFPSEHGLGGIASSRSVVFEVHDRPDPASGYVQNYRPVRGARGRAPSHVMDPYPREPSKSEACRARISASKSAELPTVRATSALRISR
jgi:hypothetical protein